MKATSSMFCPRCGEYWFPLADYVQRAFHFLHEKLALVQLVDIGICVTGAALVTYFKQA